MRINSIAFHAWRAHNGNDYHRRLATNQKVVNGGVAELADAKLLGESG
jgi:hypothetical protein